MRRPAVNPKTIILWGREDLLGQAMELFLTSGADWHVIRVSDQEDEEALIQQVERANPQAVIIYQGDCARDTRLPAHMMQGRPGLKVTTVSLESNYLEVYSKQKVCLRQAKDLLSVVEG
jgi:hypothetical protein